MFRRKNALTEVARSNLERLASSLEMSDHEWDMQWHDTCALGQARREFALDDVTSCRYVAEALELPEEVAYDLFLIGRDENGVSLPYENITKGMMVDTLRGWARTGKVRWVLE